MYEAGKLTQRLFPCRFIKFDTATQAVGY